MHRILYAAIISLTLFACQRPVDEEIQPIPPAPETEEPPTATVDSTLVSKIIYFIEPGTGPEDTTEYTSFEYDSQKRTTLSVRVEKDYSAVYSTETYRYYYNGNDTLPWKMTRQSRFNYYPEQNYDDTIFLRYQNGVVVYDSTVFYRQGSPTMHTAQSNTLVQRGDSIYIRWINQDMQGGELIVSEDRLLKVYARRSAGNLLELWSEARIYGGHYSIDYTTHPDPLRRTYVPFLFDYHAWEWGRAAYQNLPSRVLNNDAPNPPGTGFWAWFKHDYEYRPDGYPLKETVSTNSDESYFVLFQYHKR